ncbi:MAG: hypothetical protein COX77_02235 [Candidatus Komeilibacteria bacterium CG_4_10_14_0_2_um_filter_37_10]|uniref:Uncharacterized protein n=1 Tax=Candidatus Komeilibacteria bacterium CG_4_10_14_0_2_um_filter_37_10 TaxID=1974470 RepID=A0A2M7VF37_9BACT|nr:MAG: hypothetical protein COX77_02235 [Candidatus Komeilibacteria bacterium CG_4_10_14_0_2_um_filter_37_10]
MSRTLSVHKEHEFLLAMEKAGLNDALAQKVIASKSNEIAQQFIALGHDQAELILFEWQQFWEKLGIKIDITGIRIPIKKNGFDRLLVIPGNITTKKVLEFCKSFFTCWFYIAKNINSIIATNARENVVTYAIWVHDRVESDKELIGMSANDLRMKKIATMTVLERLIFELKYYQETGHHLDLENPTICSGSRCFRETDDVIFDRVIHIHWRDRWQDESLVIDNFSETEHGNHYRAREIVW